MSEESGHDQPFSAGYDTNLEDGIRNRWGRDLAVIIAVTVALTAVALGLELYDRFSGPVPDLETLNLNGIVAGLLLVPIAAGVFAMRRHRDAMHMARNLGEWHFLDQLTGLPNRRALLAEMKPIVEGARRKGGRVAVLFVDLRHIGEVNDAYGHEAGDQVLRTTATRLASFAGRKGYAARYSGDKFVVVLSDVLHLTGAQRSAEKLMDVIGQSHDLPGDDLRITATIGGVLSEPNCIEAEDLIRDADIAMQLAAEQEAGSIRIYDRSVRSRPTPSALERRLRHAVERDEFVLLFQPVVSLWTNQVAGIECLLRWNDPERGMVAPKDFLPALERTGLIVPVGQWVLRNACWKAAEWRSSYPGRPPLVVSVNVSPRQLIDPDFAQSVQDATDRVGLDRSLLCLELSNAGLALAMSDAADQLREIHELGVLVAVDDFGVGASTLVHLRDYTLDQVKIDRTFTAAIASTREDGEIVTHVVSIAKTLGLSTVAVGVETADQIAQLKSTGCDAAQGEYYAAPQPAEMIDLLLANEVGGWKPEERAPQGSEYQDPYAGPPAPPATPPPPTAAPVGPEAAPSAHQPPPPRPAAEELPPDFPTREPKDREPAVAASLAAPVASTPPPPAPAPPAGPVAPAELPRHLLATPGPPPPSAPAPAGEAPTVELPAMPLRRPASADAAIPGPSALRSIPTVGGPPIELPLTMLPTLQPADPASFEPSSVDDDAGAASDAPDPSQPDPPAS